VPFATPANRETVRKTREIGRLPRQIRRSLIISGEGVGPCAVLQKASKEVAECEPPTRKPAPTIRTIRKAKPNINGLRTLARGYEFQVALGRLFRSMRVEKSVSFHSPSEPSNHFEAHIMASLGLRASCRIH
jgi:hypothetical protein